MTIAITLFALAASGGLVLALLRFRERRLPTALAIMHGLLAVSAIVALASVGMSGTTPRLARIALAVFIAAAAGGVFLVSFQLRSRPLPKPAVVGHGLMAATAFVLLLISAL